MAIKKTLVTLIAAMLGACSSGGAQYSDTGLADGAKSRIDGTKLTDGGPTTSCVCAENEVCDTQGKCVPKPQITAVDVVGRVVLERYADPSFATISVTGGAVGRETASFYVQADPPWPDPRTKVTTNKGEVCYLDSYSCGYPNCHNEYEVWNPPGLSAGDLTFTIGGAPGPVVLKVFNAGGSGKPDDWMYAIGDQPGPLKEDSTTYGSWFDKQYLPPGAKFEMEMAGGPSFAKQKFSNLEIAAAFQITSPTPGQPVPSGGDLTISWSPAQSGATMNLEIVSGESALRCTSRDSGSITIPAAGIAKLGTVNWITLQRDVTRFAKTTSTDGKQALLYMTGRVGAGYKFN